MPRILIVDDDLHVRSVYKTFLEKEGYEVEEANNGREGLQIFRENPADLVVMDMFMPEQEGIESTMALHREFPDAKIIAISGGGKVDADNTLATAEKLGAMESLSKPIPRGRFISAVKECLSRSK